MEKFFQNEKFNNSLAGIKAEISDLDNQAKFLEDEIKKENDGVRRKFLENDLIAKKEQLQELIREFEGKIGILEQEKDEKRKWGNAGHA